MQQFLTLFYDKGDTRLPIVHWTFLGSCYDDDYNQQLRGEIALQCHGTYNCTFFVPTVPLGDECIGLIRETKVKYICGM